MSHKLGNLFALTTTLGLASMPVLANSVQTESTPQDQIDAYCTNGILTNQIDTNVCNEEAIARLISLIQANIELSTTPEEINQNNEQKAKQTSNEGVVL